MREPASRETGPDSPLTDASKRLDAALARLEAGLQATPGGGDDVDAEPDLFDRAALEQGHAAMTAELQASRERERDLLEAAAAASAALGRAAAEVRAALGSEIGEEEAA